MRKALFMLVIPFVALLMISCSKKESSISCTEIVNGAIERIPDFPAYYSFDMRDPKWEKTYGILYTLSPDDVVDICFVHSEVSDRDEEIVVVKYKTSDVAKDSLNAFEQRKRDRALDDKDVFPENVVTMVENTVIGSSGEYVFYICCVDPEKIYEYCLDKVE